MPKENSNENQSLPDTAYRFDNFELHPRERLLKRGGEAVPLPPKAFDALLCLVGKAERLVTKSELTDKLWPDTYVSEANLTNLIVCLRKVVGHDAIQTVSKHGYRFAATVEGEPHVARSMYEKFVRAKELVAHRSTESMTRARGLLWLCLAENPGFAPAWAWLGRCSWGLGKLNGNASSDVDLARAAFQRAFAIDPDLAHAHQFYTAVEADTGAALSAMERLLERADHHPGEAETFSGLVSVFRYCGMLSESLRANKRATDLDPGIVTSIPHTLFLAGEYASSIDLYGGGRTGYYLDAAAWAALGDKQRATTLLRERLEHLPKHSPMTSLMCSLRALLEGRVEEAVRWMESGGNPFEPEGWLYFARHYSQMGLAGSAIDAIRGSAQAGFVCSRETLAADPWFEDVRAHPEYGSVVRMVEDRTAQARSIFERHRVAADF
jgi:DNA-binding winged helix-turn-helix (wHTH) protein